MGLKSDGELLECTHNWLWWARPRTGYSSKPGWPGTGLYLPQALQGALGGDGAKSTTATMGAGQQRGAQQPNRELPPEPVPPMLLAKVSRGSNPSSQEEVELFSGSTRVSELVHGGGHSGGFGSSSRGAFCSAGLGGDMLVAYVYPPEAVQLAMASELLRQGVVKAPAAQWAPDEGARATPAAAAECSDAVATQRGELGAPAERGSGLLMEEEQAEPAEQLAAPGDVAGTQPSVAPASPPPPLLLPFGLPFAPGCVPVIVHHRQARASIAPAGFCLVRWFRKESTPVSAAFCSQHCRQCIQLAQCPPTPSHPPRSSTRRTSHSPTSAHLCHLPSGTHNPCNLFGGWLAQFPSFGARFA
jgi:hypothetical protein